MKRLLLGLALSLLLIPFISADLIVPVGWRILNTTIIVGIIIIETILFWLLSIKFFKIKVGFWKSLLVVAIANIVISFIGYFVSMSFSINKLIYFILIAFILSVVIEWGIYLLFFLNRKNVKKKLFYVSLIVNIVSYILFYVCNVYILF